MDTPCVCCVLGFYCTKLFIIPFISIVFGVGECRDIQDQSLHVDKGYVDVMGLLLANVRKY